MQRFVYVMAKNEHTEDPEAQKPANYGQAQHLQQHGRQF